ncbi:MAG: alpha/beta fold hydrolase [Burkholderiales bacterium]
MDNLDVTHHYAELSGVRMHYVTSGQGYPVVLLHGWPQTWYEWHKVIPLLNAKFKVIAPDLRGLGDTSRPAQGYDKKTIAEDVWELLHVKLGIEEFFLVGHDWGGPTAYSLAAHHPEAVKRLAIVDVTIPGDGSPNISQGGKRWHHGFHQTLEMPEQLIQGREHIYLGWFYRNYAFRPDAIDDASIKEYLRCYTQPGALRAGFEYYRNIPNDIAYNAKLIEGFKLPMPVLALGGAQSWGRRMEVVESLKRVAVDVRGGMVEDCGHFVPEEQPEVLAKHLLDFFRA